ncbi:MAG: hypothetical protein Q9184_007886 [Pyrenodesmia sp. 2 TL-2023]
MPIITTLIKQFLKMRGLNEVVNGGLGGFSVTCLVTSLLQNLPRVQSGEIIPEQHLGEILIEFLDLYGNQFDLARTGISMNPPGYYDKQAAERSSYHRQIYSGNLASKLAIIDPNNPQNDISGGSKNVGVIFDLFSDAYGRIMEAMRSPHRISLLDWALGGDYRSFAVQRRHLQGLYHAKWGSSDPSHTVKEIQVPNPSKQSDDGERQRSTSSVSGRPGSMFANPLDPNVIVKPKIKVPKRKGKKRKNALKAQEKAPLTSNTPYRPQIRARKLKAEFPSKATEIPDAVDKQASRTLFDKFKAEGLIPIECTQSEYLAIYRKVTNDASGQTKSASHKSKRVKDVKLKILPIPKPKPKTKQQESRPKPRPQPNAHGTYQAATNFYLYANTEKFGQMTGIFSHCRFGFTPNGREEEPARIKNSASRYVDFTDWEKDGGVGITSALDKLADEFQDFRRILEMGNDGGSIPTRRELVREAAKDKTSTQVKEVQTEKLEHYWSYCALSQKPLAPPIVSDSTGNLYNKDAVLEHLLGAGKQSREENVADNDRTTGTIRSLRDVVEVQFGVEEDEEAETRDSKSVPTRLVCPVSGKRLGPGVKAVYLVPCGHAFAESAVREMPGEQCLQCNETYTADNVIPILPASTPDKDRLRDRLSRLQSAGLTHSLKKAPGSGKKRKKDKSTKEEDTTDAADVAAGPAIPPLHEAIAPSSKAIRNEDTASLTAKVLAEQDDRNKRRKIAQNDNLKTLFSSSSGMAGKQKDFMTRGFTIPADAKR